MRFPDFEKYIKIVMQYSIYSYLAEERLYNNTKIILNLQFKYFRFRIKI